MSRKNRILVVDDYEPILKLAVKLFTDRGYEVFGAESGEDAMEILRKQEVDLVFTDLHLQLGGMDGFDLAKLAKERHPSLLVVLTSSDRQGLEALSNARPPSIDDYLLKPWNLIEAANIVKKVLTRVSV